MTTTTATPLPPPPSTLPPAPVPVSVSTETPLARGALLPTPRLLLLGLGAAAIGAAMTWFPEAALLLALWIGAAVALAVADLLWSAKPRQLRARREHESIFALGATNPVWLTVENRSPQRLQVELRDEYPEEFASDAVVLAAEVGPGRAATLGYRLTPPRRGEYAFADLNLRYPTRLGLWLRQARYPARRTVRVYPNLREVAKYELLARKGLTQEIGLRNARRLGEGTEFERLRDYVPDDEFRRIDWKASARRGKLIAREYETERSQHVLLMLDVGRLMNVPVPPLLKLDWAVNAALMLSWVALGRGDRVGMLAFGGAVRGYLPPGRGRRQFEAMLERLYGVQPEMAEPDFDAAFRYLALRNPKRSLVVLFTDLVDPEVSRLLIRYLAHLVPHHVAVCVTIDDPAITRLAEQPVSEPVTVWERALARQLLSERREVMTQLQRSSVITIDTPADKLNAALINRYLELKARGAI